MDVARGQVRRDVQERGGAEQIGPAGSIPSVGTTAVASASSTGGGPGGGTGGAPGGWTGGPEVATTTSSALAAALTAADGRWSAAVVGARSAAELELASGASVMAIGGWSGSDASPTLARSEAYVAQGEIGYLVVSGDGQGGGAGGQSSGTGGSITAWVEVTYTATTVGGTTVYDLTASA